MDRVIALIDMDCFYVQCEQRLAPQLWSHPCAVAQYNNWKGGGLIAVNYEARSHGVKRGMRGNEATALCPDLHIFSVPEVRGKADLSRYREASGQVFEAIKQMVDSINVNVIVEKASIDEAFIDLTQEIDAMLHRLKSVPELKDLSDTKLELNVENNDLNQWLNNLRQNEFVFNANDIRLALGAVLCQQIRKEILDKTEFKCSAGISHNKMLAKLACALNKPNAQTILPKAGVDQLFGRIDINKVRSLGGKLGAHVKQVFKINTMYELKCLELNQLAKHFDIKTAKWLKDMANGLDDEPLINRQVSKSLGCGKNFPGKSALTTLQDVNHWLKQLCEELVERMTRDKETNKRSAKLITIGFSFKERDHNSKSLPIDQYMESKQLAEHVMKRVFSKIKFEPIFNLSIAASKFVDDCDDPSNNTIKLDNYFTKINKNELSDNKMSDNCNPSTKKFKSSSNQSHTRTLEEFWNSNKTSENQWKDSDIEVIETNDSNNISNNTTNDISIVDIRDETNRILDENQTNNEKPIKRGFFYRKLMQFRAEEREKNKFK